MKLIFLISLRNLIRQKRRNILMGLLLALCVMFMTVAMSFSRGITDNLLNKVIVYVAGHIKIKGIEESRSMLPVIRDKAKILKIIDETIPADKDIVEHLGTMCRAIGIGKADYVYIDGIKIDDEFKSFFQIKEGSWEDFETAKYLNPLVLSETKAKALNAKPGDQIRIRLDNVNGQKQTGVCTVTTIIKSQNMFMDYAIFTPITSLKKIMGYKPHETGSIVINLKNPQDAIKYADKLHTKLKADKAFFTGNVILGGKLEAGGSEVEEKVGIIGLNKKVSTDVLEKQLNFITKTWDADQRGAIISEIFSKRTGLLVNDRVQLKITPKFSKEPVITTFKITAIAGYSGGLETNLLILNEKAFFKIFNYYLPTAELPISSAISLTKDKAFWNEIATEWNLLKRTRTTKEFQKKYKEAAMEINYQPYLDVSTMYESASMIIKMEMIFYAVTLAATSVLFLIIMIGYLNSLRMSIRERTKEIGTIRAIGMRQKDVKRIFLTETLLLVFFGWIVGTLLAFGIMELLALKQFSHDNAFNMLMVDRRLYFLPNFWILSANLLIVIVFGLITAYFPSSKASKMDPVEALRHSS